MSVIAFAEAVRRRNDKRGKGARWSWGFSKDGEIVITMYGPNGIEEDEARFSAEGSKKIIDFLHRKLRQREIAAWNASHPKPTKPPPKWKRCGRNPVGDRRRGPSGCVRREGHEGDHRDRNGTTFTIAACIHPKPHCFVTTPNGERHMQCNACGRILEGM